MRGSLTEVRPASPGDVELLVRWHEDPDVARFWRGKTYTREEMRARLRRPDVDAFIVEADGQPVGYLQVWRGDEPGTGGLDMFLVPEARGRGLGPDAARAMALDLVRDRDWTRLTVDPELWNERAVRAWQRAGFTPVEECPPDDEHDAPWLLMLFEP